MVQEGDAHVVHGGDGESHRPQPLCICAPWRDARCRDFQPCLSYLVHSFSLHFPSLFVTRVGFRLRCFLSLPSCMITCVEPLDGVRTAKLTPFMLQNAMVHYGKGVVHPPSVFDSHVCGRDDKLACM